MMRHTDTLKLEENQAECEQLSTFRSSDSLPAEKPS